MMFPNLPQEEKNAIIQAALQGGPTGLIRRKFMGWADPAADPGPGAGG